MEIESSPGSQLKPIDREAAQERQGRKKGGWITLPFIAGAYEITSLSPSERSLFDLVKKSYLMIYMISLSS